MSFTLVFPATMTGMVRPLCQNVSCTFAALYLTEAISSAAKASFIPSSADSSGSGFIFA
jgi:hypothetical protein